MTALSFSLSLLHTKQKHVWKNLAFRGIKIIQLLSSLTEKHDVPSHESSLQGNGHKLYCEAHWEVTSTGPKERGSFWCVTRAWLLRIPAVIVPLAWYMGWATVRRWNCCWHLPGGDPFQVGRRHRNIFLASLCLFFSTSWINVPNKPNCCSNWTLTM